MAGEKEIPIAARPLMMKHVNLMVRCTACEVTNHRFFNAKDHLPSTEPLRTITCTGCKKDFEILRHPSDKQIDAIILAASVNSPT